jgi:hypothetical protein
MAKKDNEASELVEKQGSVLNVEMPALKAPSEPPAPEKADAVVGEPAVSGPAVIEVAEKTEATEKTEAAEDKLQRLLFEKTEVERLAAEAAEAHRLEIEKTQEELKRLNFERDSQHQRRKEEAIAAVQALRVVNDFKCAMNGNLVQFKKGEIVTDRLLIVFLLEQKLPVVPAEENIDFYFCKHCHQKNEI